MWFLARKKEKNDKDVLGLVVQDLTAELANRLGYEDDKGVVIKEVLPDSPASEAGLSPGILIQEVNQQTVKNIAEFNAIIAKLNPADGILFLVRNRQGASYVFIKGQ